MIEELKGRIERYYEEAKTNNPLFSASHDGSLTPEKFQNYLRSTQYLVQHTPIHLLKAETVARLRGQEDLAAFFSEKRGEEVGHDRWAEEDLSKLRDAFRPVGTAEVVPAIVELVGFIESLIDEDPALYLPYIFLAEYFVVIMGPTWLSDLEDRCGISKELVSVIGNHAELDKAHIHHDLVAMGGLVNAAQYREKFLRTLEQCLSHYDKFSAQVAGVHA